MLKPGPRRSLLRFLSSNLRQQKRGKKEAALRDGLKLINVIMGYSPMDWEGILLPGSSIPP
jgi:hypothetical protein